MYHHSSCIRIENTEFKGDGTRRQKLSMETFTLQPVSLGNAWDTFRDSTIFALNAINDLPSGRKMLEEINGSGNLVTIGSTPAERMDLDRGSQLNNSCYSGETAAQFYQATDTAAGLTQVLQKAAAFLAQRADAALTQSVLCGMLRDLVASYCSSVVWANPSAPWSANWQVTGFSINSNRATYLRYALEAFLMPGPGGPATIRWHRDSTQFQGEMTRKIGEAEIKAKGQVVMGSGFVARLPFIALAHELVHAWRAVTGRCIFATADWLQDEQTTVGLMPSIVDASKQSTGAANLARAGQLVALLRTNAASNRVTENRIRADARMALRPMY